VQEHQQQQQPSTRPRRGYFSRFGGLWTDLYEADERLTAMLAEGAVTNREAEQLRFWMRDGYVVLEDAVPLPIIDRVVEDVEAAWRGELPRTQIEFPRDGAIRIERPAPEFRSEAHKLLSLHAESVAAREAIFANPILDFLTLVYERAPLAFSTLGFDIGTRQPIHQDTAYVAVSSPMDMVASWIALEDVNGVCGALEYYEGSHRIPESVFPDGMRLMPVELQTEEAYHYHLQAMCRQLRCNLKEFRPRKGTALIWSADLVHGGKREIQPGTSRRSLVTHYCPIDSEPVYFDYWEHSGKLEHAPGAHYSWYQR
jgi:phytanoyl-CoA hydroxylase